MSPTESAWKLAEVHSHRLPANSAHDVQTKGCPHNVPTLQGHQPVRGDIPLTRATFKTNWDVIEALLIQV